MLPLTLNLGAEWKMSLSLFIAIVYIYTGCSTQLNYVSSYYVHTQVHVVMYV